MVDALDALRLGIEREKGAHKFYSDAAQKVTNEASRSMFNWLAGEEQGHIRVLEKAQQAVQSKKGWPGEQECRDSGDLSQPVEKAEFPKLAEAKAEVKEDVPEMEILSRAIADERDAMYFYTELGEGISDPEGKKMMKTLAAIEKGHLELLEEEYEWLRRSRQTFTIHRFTLPGKS